MLRSFIQVTALGLSLIATFFLLQGPLTLSAKDIADLSTPKVMGHNPDLVKNLAGQQVDSTVGFVLLLFSFALQTANLLWPLRWDDFKVSKGGSVIAICFLITVCLLSYYARNLLYDKTQREIAKVFIDRQNHSD